MIYSFQSLTISTHAMEQPNETVEKHLFEPSNYT